jgi:hypothetical protein
MPEKPTYEDLEQQIRELKRAESERNQVEAALRESEDFLNRTGVMAKVGGWKLDL